MKAMDCVLFSGAANGAESAFGAASEKRGIDEVNFTFEGHNDTRQRGIRVLTHEELVQGDVSLAYVSQLMHRRSNCNHLQFHEIETRKLSQDRLTVKPEYPCRLANSHPLDMAGSSNMSA